MAKKTATVQNSATKNKAGKKSDYTNGLNDKAEVRIEKMKFMDKEVDIELISKFDTSGFDKDKIIDWYKLNHLGRRLDEKAALYLKMAKGWSYHAPFAGHDGIQLALGQIFRPKKDHLFPYYRDMMTSLAAGLTPEEIILNGLSKETDVAGGGRHMSNHFAKPSVNVHNVSSNTGNHSLHAAGLARAIKKLKGDEVAYYSGGDSAVAEGYFYEAINTANFEKTPVIFVIQNNQYGISVPLRDVSGNLNVSDNFIGFKNTLILNCDGRDPFDSYKKLEEARDYALSGKGPAIVHAVCDRIGSHSNSDRHELYRSDDERMTVTRRDPLLQFRHYILDNELLTEEELQKIEAENKQAIFDAADKAEAAPNANGKSYPDFVLPEAIVTLENDQEKGLDTSADQISYIQALNETLKEEFRRNPLAYMWGQDIGKGGVFNVVKGMPEEFGRDRVFNAAIAEDSIVGTANGFTRYKKELRAVIEGAEFADYFWPAMEQLVECSHDYWRTKGQFAPNVTIRLASGGYIQGGLYHSQNLEATFATLPGLRIVQPAFADDVVGLLRNSIRSEGPTLFLEPKFLYNFKRAYGPKPPEDYIIPFGKGKIRREGTDVSIVAYGTAVHMAMLAAEEMEKSEGISVEVVDLRSLSPLDKDIIINSVKKTNRVIVAHEDKVFGGFGGELSAIISEEAFNYLDAPVLRIGSKYTPVGFAKEYEHEILLKIEDVKAAIEKIVRY